MAEETQITENNAAEDAEINTEDVWSQVEDLTVRLDVAQAIAGKAATRAEELKNYADRLQADFDNYRKRTAENAKKLKEDGIIEVIEKMIPLVDTLYQAIAMMTDENTANGIRMVLRQFNDVLNGFGVSEIPALGEVFDPNLHNAVADVKVKDKSSVNVIVEVFRKGYRIGDRVVRHSVVKVGK